MKDYADLLGSDGPFADKLPGFASRVQQQQLAGHIGQALENAEALVAEAGTGIGKTFAYLVPEIGRAHV